SQDGSWPKGHIHHRTRSSESPSKTPDSHRRTSSPKTSEFHSWGQTLCDHTSTETRSAVGPMAKPHHSPRWLQFWVAAAAPSPGLGPPMHKGPQNGFLEHYLRGVALGLRQPSPTGAYRILRRTRALARCRFDGF